MAWICSYYYKMYDQVMYEGKSMLYWCKREVKWGTDYLLKLHLYEGSTRPSTWNDKTDRLVVMVRASRLSFWICLESCCNHSVERSTANLLSNMRAEG
jgi:hypothetical protein